MSAAKVRYAGTGNVSSGGTFRRGGLRPSCVICIQGFSVLLL